MKKVLSSFGWILLLLPLVSVAGARTALNTINLNAFDEQNREVANFSGVASSGAFDVFIKIGNQESLKLEGDGEILDRVETPVEDGILHIRMKKGTNRINMNFKKIKVYITAKKLNNLVVSGSGNINVEDKLKADDFSATVSGSGNISADLAATRLKAVVSGSGKIMASGNAKQTEVVVSGSGHFNGKNFNTDSADAKVSGSGHISIQADDTLNAAVSGSGNISYSGNAKVNMQKSGSGSITRI